MNKTNKCKEGENNKDSNKKTKSEKKKILPPS